MSKRKYFFNERFFETIDSQEKAYLLGFLYADGNISNNKYYINIDLAEYDKEILDMFIKELNYNIYPKLNEREINSNKYLKLSIGSKAMCTDLIKIGCTPNKTLQLCYPKIDDKYHRHFIRGYFDGDGTVTRNKDRCYIKITSTKLFLNKIYFILNKELNININKLIKSNKIYNLSLSSINDTIKFYNYIYKNANLFLKRKYNKYTELYEINKKSNRIDWTPTSKYKGVFYDKSRNKWKATFGKKQLGRFNSEKEALNERRKYIEKISSH